MYFLKQSNRAQSAVLGCLSLMGLALMGCSSHRADSSASTDTVASSTSTDVAPAPPQTVTDALGDTPDNPEAPGTSTVIQDAGPALNPSAPKDYVVQRGDTLWHIATVFLKNPWEWPEIWYVNPDIKNPHRIYPGDTVHLALSRDGRTALQVVRGENGLAATRLEPLLRSTQLEGPIASIPYSEISAFLSHPGVLTLEEVKAAPYILSLTGDHVIAGAGDELFVKKLDGEAGARYAVMQVDEPLRDPDSGRHLGYLAIYAGTAQLTKPGRISRATLTDSAREALQGDVLIPEDNTPNADIAPHSPTKQVDGKILVVVNHSLIGGLYDVVALSKGSDEGLDRGSVLNVDQAEESTNDRCARIEGSSTCLFHPTEKLPVNQAATLLVFKTYHHMSYALAVQDSVPIHVGDRVHTP